MWAIEYVQVPIVKEKSDAEQVLGGVAQGNAAGIGEVATGAAASSVTLINSDSNCSLASEDEASVKEEEEDNDDSVKEEADDESPTKVRMALNVVSLQQKRPSLVSAKSLHEQINNIVRKANGEWG